MSSLDDYTDSALKWELERRRIIREEKPNVLDLIDWGSIQRMVMKEFDFILENNGEGSTDFKHYLYEDCFETVYGTKVWDYINNLDC